MAGSKVLCGYDSDEGVTFNVIVDKSNAKATGFSNNDPDNPPLPKGTTMRYALGFFVAAPTIKRKIWIGSSELATQLLIATNPTIQLQRYPGVNEEDFRITFISGERKKVPSYAETGMNDGTTGTPNP